MKKCTKCGLLKEDSCFSKNSANADGLYNFCKECDKQRQLEYKQKNKDKLKESQKKYREANRELINQRVKDHYERNKKDIYAKKRSSRRLKEAYCSEELYNELLKKQKGCCAICGISEEEHGKQLSADHCHNKKQVRGLLCNSCNLLLGYAKDKSHTLLMAIAYLKSPPNRVKDTNE